MKKLDARLADKAQQRWVWHAIDPLTGVVLASTCGSRAEEMVGEGQKVLTPFGLEPFSPEAAGVYERHLLAAAHTVGQVHTQQSERHQLT